MFHVFPVLFELESWTVVTIMTLVAGLFHLHQRDFQHLFTLKAITPLLPNLEIHVLADGWYHPDLGIVIEQRPLEDFLV